MRHTLTLLGLLLASACLGQSALENQQDSIFISFDEQGNKTFQHVMLEDETLYSLSRFYGLTLEQLFIFNPTMIEAIWEVGQELTIPLPNRAIIRYTETADETKKLIPLYYKTRPGDTMFGLAKKRFKMPVEDLLIRNQLKDHTLSLNQVLLLGWMKSDGIPKSYQGGTKVAPPSNEIGEFFEKGDALEGAIYEHGMAYWDTEGNSSGDLFTLHRTAAINSKIAVHNPMNRKTVYAKVIGRLPENVYPDKVMVVISPKVAKLLGALDGQFFVKVRYLR